jgi:hypothetical protein
VTQDPSTSPAPAGWYPDPSGAAALRWWDGSAWTAEEHPVTTGGHPRWRRIVAVVLVIALVAATTAAAVAVWRGSSAAVRLDTAAIEREIARVLTQQRGEPTTVDCPDDVRLEAGAVMTCTSSTADGSTGTVLVRQDNDQGDVTWRVGD